MAGKIDPTDIIGKKFNLLTPYDYYEKRTPRKTPNHGNKTRHLYIYKCHCDCGNEFEVERYNLMSGHTQSCGCQHKERARKACADALRTHGDSYARLYTIYRGMRDRCENPNGHAYQWYGERGIKVCDEWANSYEVFREWALSHGYTDELTIDRIDFNGNYEPDNCRWVTMKEQQNNRCNNNYIEYEGKTYTLTQLAEAHNIVPSTLHTRLYLYGWDLETALHKPIMQNNSKGPRKKRKQSQVSEAMLQPSLT